MRYVFGAIFLATIVLIGWGAISQHLPKAQQLDSKQQTDGGLKHQKESNPSKSLKEHKNVRNDNAGRSDKEPPETYVFLGKALKVTDSFTAVFTLVIAIFTIGLFLDARDKGRRELRAYLGVTNGTLKFIPNTNHLRAEIELTNSGQTTAQKVSYAIDGDLRLPDDNRPFEVLKSDGRNQPMAPGSHWSFGHEWDLSDADRQDIRSDKKYVFVWGRADYFDIFGKPQSIQFRYRNVVKQIGFDPRTGASDIVSWAFYPEEEGNKAT